MESVERKPKLVKSSHNLSSIYLQKMYLNVTYSVLLGIRYSWTIHNTSKAGQNISTQRWSFITFKQSATKYSQWLHYFKKDSGWTAYKLEAMVRIHQDI